MELTWYEQHQAHNFITRWLHSFRYQHAIRVVSALAATLDRPVRIVDIGCGYAKLFDVLNARTSIDYQGIELDPSFAQSARDRHREYPNFKLLEESALTALSKCDKPDIVMALETFEHIPGNDLVRLVERIAALRVSLFVTVPIEIGPAIWMKNIGSWLFRYCRHWEYTWAQTCWAGLYQLDKIPAHTINHRGFDWRWLAQTIRHNMRIVKTIRFPVAFLPASVNASICFISEPRTAPPHS